MAVKDVQYLKDKFQTGDIPTEIDYVDLIDSTHNSALEGVYEPVGTIVKDGDGTQFLSNDGTYTTINITGGHDPVTISDSTSINLSLTGQELTAEAIFGTEAGTIAEGNHLHDERYLTIAASGEAVIDHEQEYNHSYIHTHSNKTTLDDIPVPTNGDEGKSLKVNSTHNGFIYSKDLVSAGIIGNPPTITMNGLIATVPTCQVALFDNANFTGSLRQYTVPQTNLTFIDNSVNYVYVSHNNGTPVFLVSTQVSDINESNIIPVNTVLVTNGNTHLSHWDSIGDGLANKLHRRFVKTQRYARETGLALSNDNGVISIGYGIVWRGARAFELLETISNGTNDSKWFFYYHNNSSWIPQYQAPAFNNTYYDNGTNLIHLNPQKFTINWVYRGVEDHRHGYYILGNKEYKDLPTAIAETAIPELPIDISSHAILVGRIIVEHESSVLYIESAFDAQFQGTIINEHNSLAGIQGGTTDEFYHLTNNQYLNNVYSPSGSVNNNIVVFDGTSGKSIKDSGIPLSSLATSDQGVKGEQAYIALTSMKEPTGYLNPPVTPVWGGLNNRVLTFSGPDTIFFQSKMFTKSNYSFDANASGNGKFFFYWESDGAGGLRIAYSPNSWDFDNNKIMIAIIYVSTTSVDYGKEWHGCKMDVDTHARLHSVGGTELSNGGLEVTATDSGITITEGTLWDEDLPLYIPEQTSVGVSYWTGSNYDRTTLKTSYYCFSGTTPEYNNGGTITDLTDGYFGLYWIIGTHRTATPIVSLLHTTQYVTINEAQSGMFHTDIRAVIDTNAGGAQELQPIACVVCENIGGVNNYIETYDLRYTSNKIKQDVNTNSKVHFQDVYIHELSGTVIGPSHSVKTALKNIDNLIAGAVYYPVSHRLTSANADAILSGSVVSLTTLDSSIAGSVTIDENNGGSDTGFQYRARLEPTTSFNTIQLANNYNGNGHNMQIGIVRSNGVTIDPLCYYGTGLGVALSLNTWTNNTFTIASYLDYIQNDGVDFVEIAYNHTSPGSNAHVLYVDKIALIKASAGSSPLDADNTTKGITKLDVLGTAVITGTATDIAVTPAGVTARINSKLASVNSTSWATASRNFTM